MLNNVNKDLTSIFPISIMKQYLRIITLGLLTWLISFSAVHADPEPTTPAVPTEPAEPTAPTEPEAPENADEEPKPEFEATETEIKLPGVTINRTTREVRIDAVVCLDTGLLEFVVCRPDTFEHEAIFTTTAKPELVHAALLLSGMKPTPLHRGLTDLWSEKAMKQKQSRLKIEVEWEEKDVKKRVNLTSMIKDREGDAEDYGIAPAEPAQKPKEKKESKVQDAWIFTGSFLHVNPETKKQFYAANSSGILVGIWPDPSTVIQYGIQSGDPYAGDHLGMAINEEAVPKVGTKVKLVFSQFTEPAEKVEPKK
jgi:hypothetical protein